MKFKWCRRFFSAFFILAIILLLAAFYTCGDVGLDENFFASVQGEIHIDSVVPDATDELILALMDGLTPRFTQTISRRELSPTDSSQDVPFILEAQTGDFDALFVIWKQRGQPISVIENLVGSYCEDGALIPISITEDQRLVDRVSIDIGLRKVNRTANVAGVIHFNGWPENIENLGIVFADLSLLQDQTVCNLLRNADIRFLPTAQVDSLNFKFSIAPGPTIMVIAFNQVGGSILEPNIVTSSLTAFEAFPDSSIKVETTANFGNIQY